MSYVLRDVHTRRTPEEYIDLIFRIIDQGFARVSQADINLFNAFRRGILEEPYTKSDKKLLESISCSKMVIEEVKKRCREEHIVRLKTQAYKSNERNRKPKFDYITLADMYIGYMNGEQVSKKYGISPSTVVSYIYSIRHKPQYEETRSVLLSKGVNLTERKSFKKHPSKGTVRDDEVTVDNMSAHDSVNSLRNSLFDLATTKEVINLFMTNTDARNAFYDLLNSLS